VGGRREGDLREFVEGRGVFWVKRVGSLSSFRPLKAIKGCVTDKQLESLRVFVADSAVVVEGMGARFDCFRRLGEMIVFLGIDNCLTRN
jgi:hypothetical protein